MQELFTLFPPYSNNTARKPPPIFVHMCSLKLSFQHHYRVSDKELMQFTVSNLITGM